MPGALSQPWGFAHAVFSAETPLSLCPLPQLLFSDIFLILLILNLDVPSSGNLPSLGPSTQCLSCVHLRALNPPTIALSPTIKLSACLHPPLDCKLHEGRACVVPDLPLGAAEPVLVERAGGAQAVGA